MYDTFEDNTFAITISLQEYRELVSFQATAGYQMNELMGQVQELEKRNSNLIDQVMLLQEAVTEEPSDET